MAVNDPQFRQQWALNGSAGPSIETAWANAPKRGAGPGGPFTILG